MGFVVGVVVGLVGFKVGKEVGKLVGADVGSVTGFSKLEVIILHNDVFMKTIFLQMATLRPVDQNQDYGLFGDLHTKEPFNSSIFVPGA